MPVFSFRTITHPTEGLYKEKGSKFLAFAYPVQDESDIREKLEALRKTYFDARHHCYAWVLGPERSHLRAADDGEPNHSAGDPILGQIRSRELTNVLVVVVRYFGGIKLGVGGLVAAYKAAADDALSKATVVDITVTISCRLTYDYAATPEAMRLVKEFDLQITQQQFTGDCTLDILVALEQKEKVWDKVALLRATGTSIAISDI